MERKERLILWGIALCAFLFSMAFALTNPPFESPDEPEHLRYVEYVADNASLPNQYKDDGPRRIAQGHHHPLYYLFSASLLKVIHADGLTYDIPENPHAYERDDAPRFVTSQIRFDPPSTKAVFYALRIQNAFYAALCALFAALAARMLIGKQYALFAGAFIATLPQYQFVSGSISNDSLTACLGAVSLYMLVRAGIEKQTWQSWAWAGFWVGMALLAKKSNLVIIPPALLWIAIHPMRNKEAGAKARWIAGAAFGVAFLLVAGWLFARNIILYHELLGNRMERETLTDLVHPKSITDRYFMGSFEKVTARTFFAHFGWMNVTVSLALILPLALLLFTGLGASWKAMKEWAMKSAWWFAGAWVILTVAGLFYYNLTFTQPQGRLLFPALAPLSLLFAAGATRLLERLDPKKAKIAISGIAILLVLIDIACLLINLRFYGRPEVNG